MTRRGDCICRIDSKVIILGPMGDRGIRSSSVSRRDGWRFLYRGKAGVSHGACVSLLFWKTKISDQVLCISFVDLGCFRWIIPFGRASWGMEHGSGAGGTENRSMGGGTAMPLAVILLFFSFVIQRSSTTSPTSHFPVSRESSHFSV